MLVLTRKTGEKIHVGSQIVVEIMRIDGKAVRVGIEAPRSMPIRRGELDARADTPLEPSDQEATIATLREVIRGQLEQIHELEAKLDQIALATFGGIPKKP